MVIQDSLGRHGDAEWRSRQARYRPYEVEVVPVIERLRGRFEVVTYGSLDYRDDQYPLYALKTPNWLDELP